MDTIRLLKIRYALCIAVGAILSYFALATFVSRFLDIQFPLPAAGVFYFFINPGVFVGLPVMSLFIYKWSKTRAGMTVAALYAVLWLAALAVALFIIIRFWL